ncbi:hypothetical protein MTR67_012568 [Solanum verrucosum]|uniref:Uncharacterized protein n=1 Tax=Solanum verrucosum TaxID=315347 RepID=A0AAF0Q9Z6_SOLVR|nr:hypothetical protein MTR67_012568 [Solanum verrucosum]
MDLQFEGMQPSAASHLLQSLHLFLLVDVEIFDPATPLFPHYDIPQDASLHSSQTEKQKHYQRYLLSLLH